MPAPTIEDYNNGKEDLDFVAAIANGEGDDPIASRLGAEARPLPGLMAELAAVVAAQHVEEETATAQAAISTAQRVLAEAAANVAEGARDDTQDLLDNAAAVTAPVGAFVSRAAMNAALAGDAGGALYPAGSILVVTKDEANGDRATYSQRVGLAAVGTFSNFVSNEIGRWYFNPETGDDANPGTEASPKKKLQVANDDGILKFGDHVYLAAGSVWTDDWDIFGGDRLPQGLVFDTFGGGTNAIFNAFDRIPPEDWVANGDSFNAEVEHAFGGDAGAEVAGNRIYPDIIYRDPETGDWRRVVAYYPDEFANDAAGIAFVQANEGTLYVEDLDNASSFSAGWAKGTFKYHVHLPDDLDPSDTVVMVKQRMQPNFGAFSSLRNIEFFGTVGHDGIQMPGGYIENCAMRFTSHHACEIPGTNTVDFEVSDGTLKTAGYALHHFGDEHEWPQQKWSHHLRPRVINHNGSILGAHGTTMDDGGGGPGNPISLVVIDDGYFKNCATTDTVTGLGAVWNRCVFDGVGSISGAGEYNDCRAMGVQALGGAATGYRQNINRCQIQMVGQLFGQIFKMGGANGGKCAVKDSVIYASVPAALVYHFSGDSPDIELHRTVIAAGEGTIKRPIATGTGGAIQGTPTLAITESHITGFGHLVLAGIADVTVDDVTVFGGRTGLIPQRDPKQPFLFERGATYWSLGDRMWDVFPGTIGGGDYIWGVSSKAFYNLTYGGGELVPQALWPAGFEPRCGAGKGAPDNAGLYFAGLDGKVYKTPDPFGFPVVFTAVAGAPAYDYLAMQRIGTTNQIILVASNGHVVSLNTTTEAFTDLGEWATGGHPLNWVRCFDANKWLVGGSAADDDPGGTYYTSNAGAAHAACDFTGTDPTGTKDAALVNGFYVIAGHGREIWTSPDTDIDGPYTARFKPTLPHIYSFAVDATNKRLMYAGHFNIPQGSLGDAITIAYGARRYAGYIDCSDANPANWVDHPFRTDLPTASFVEFSAAPFDGDWNGVAVDAVVVGDFPSVAMALTSKGEDFETNFRAVDISRGEGTIYERPSQARLIADLVELTMP